MILSEMIAFVRRQADADESDAPDDNLSVYARMAYNDILSRRVRWPHLAVSYEFTTNIGGTSYPISSIGGGDLEFVSSLIVVGSHVLAYASPEDFDLLSIGDETGSLVFYTIEDDQVKLYPAPAGEFTIRVKGYRRQSDWPVGDVAPDLPREFDEPICFAMLGKYFLSQEEQGLASQYLSLFDMGVAKLIRNATRSAADPRPKVMGPPRGRTVPRWLGWVD